MKPRILTKEGKPYQIVISYAEYIELLEYKERYLLTQAPLSNVGELPTEVVRRLMDGVSPVRAWRIYRGMSQTDLAIETKLSPALLSQIENNKKVISELSRKAIAHVLRIPLEYVR